MHPSTHLLSWSSHASISTDPLIDLPLTPSKGAGGDVFLAALRQKALPFLLAPTASGGEASQDDACWDGPPVLLVESDMRLIGTGFALGLR